MSLKDVEGAVKKFIESGHPQAIAISGSWGSGKTHFWGDFIKKNSKKATFKKYSYVSLFGINDLSDLKATLFDNAVSARDVEDGDGANSSTWAKNAKEAYEAIDGHRLKDSQKPLQGLAKWAWKIFSPVLPALSVWGGVARSLSFMLIKDYVICLDDVERKGESLPLKEVCGLISLLKEQKGCRVVVILNDGELDKEKDVFDNFREKVFDNEIVFSPSAGECAKLVFNDKWEYREYSDSVIKKVVRLDIKNIRVLQRIRLVIESLLPYVQGKDEALTTQLIHSSVLLTWCYNSRGKGVPSYELLKDLSSSTWRSSGDGGSKEEEGDEKRRVEMVLTNYGYGDSDEFDLHICQFLENGYVEKSDFVAVVASFQERALKDRKTGNFSKAWRLFHDTFADNGKILVEKLREAFLDGARFINIRSAMDTVKLIRDLGRDDIADELIRSWVDMAKSEDEELLDLKDARLRRKDVDEKFMEAIKSAYVAKDGPLQTLEEVIKTVTDKNSWDDIKLDILADASSDDYYRFFKSIDNDEHLKSYIDACLLFRTYNDATGRCDKIHNATVEALKRISSESPLNRLRVALHLPSEDL